MEATYNDGEAATSHPVVLRIEGPALLIEGADGAPLARWPLTQVRLVGKAGDGGLPRLRPDFESDARVTLRSVADVESLAPFCPAMSKTTQGALASWRPLLLWGGAAAASIVLLFTVLLPWGAGLAARSMPPDMAQALGKRVAEQSTVLFSGKPFPDGTCKGTVGQAALERLAHRLAAGLDEPVDLRLMTIDTDAANALALPGGYILVLGGLIEKTENGDELAGVIAHEIGHVAERHPLTIFAERAGASLMIGFLLGDVTGGAVLAGAAELLLGAAYSRELEEEADAIGLALMEKAGLDGRAVADLLARLEEDEGPMGAIDDAFSFLSTHPPTEARAALAKAAPTARGPAFSDAEWKAIRTMCEGE